jgi:hypothetical protein
LAVLASLIQAQAAAQGKPPELRVLGTHESGRFNVGGAEIPTYDPITRRAFVVNAGSATVDVLDLRNPGEPAKIGSLDIVADLAPRSVSAANSVDTRFGLLAVAAEAEPRQKNGWVAFHSTLTLDLPERSGSTTSTWARRATTNCRPTWGHAPGEQRDRGHRHHERARREDLRPRLQVPPQGWERARRGR